jgi:hypothetical protein
MIKSVMPNAAIMACHGVNRQSKENSPKDPRPNSSGVGPEAGLTPESVDLGPVDRANEK